MLLVILVEFGQGNERTHPELEVSINTLNPKFTNSLSHHQQSVFDCTTGPEVPVPEISTCIICLLLRFIVKFCSFINTTQVSYLSNFRVVPHLTAVMGELCSGLEAGK